MSSSSNVTNTYSPFENETLSCLDILENGTERFNINNQQQQSTSMSTVESTVMLKAYKLPNNQKSKSN